MAIEERAAEAARNRPLPYIGEAIPIGLLGAAAVALYILVVDALAGAPMATPSALGASLILGEPFSPDAAVRPALVFGYTLLHGFVFIVVAAAAVSTEHILTERGMSLALRAVLSALGLVVALTVLFYLLTLMVDVPLAGSIAFERILAANLIAALTMTLALVVRDEARTRTAAIAEASGAPDAAAE